MLLPSGRMEQPLFNILRMADAIALWKDGMATVYFCDGRCYSQVANVKDSSRYMYRTPREHTGKGEHG